MTPLRTQIVYAIFAVLKLPFQETDVGLWVAVHSHHVLRREDLLDLNDVLQHPGRQLAVDISTELTEEEDLDLVAPLDGFLEAVSTGSLLLLNGQFKTSVVLECSRCSAPLETPIEFDLDEQFPVEGVPSSFNPSDIAKVAPDEPFELFEGNVLLVENLLRQGLLLALPLQRLCEHGWDGPCPIAAARAVAAAKVEQELSTETQRPFLGLANLLGTATDEFEDLDSEE